MKATHIEVNCISKHSVKNLAYMASDNNSGGSNYRDVSRSKSLSNETVTVLATTVVSETRNVNQ